MPQENRRKLVILLGAAAALWIFLRYCLSFCLPFLLALGISLAAESLVKSLEQRLRLPRAAAAAAGMSLWLCCAVLLLLALASLVWRALGLLAGILPDVEQTALDGMELAEEKLLALTYEAPEGLQSTLQHTVTSLFCDSTALLDEASGSLLRLLSGAAVQVSNLGFAALTCVLASYMFCAAGPKLRDRLRRSLPDGLPERAAPVLARCRQNLRSYLIAQCKLLGVTFGVLIVGFLLLRIHYAAAWAAAIAAVDALPILGTGTVLLPWCALCLFRGETLRCVGLFAVYVLVSVLHTVLEPRFLGKQLGVPPLFTLFALYAGWKLWGVAGMLLFPLLAVTLYQLLRGEEK